MENERKKPKFLKQLLVMVAMLVLSTVSLAGGAALLTGCTMQADANNMTTNGGGGGGDIARPTPPPAPVLSHNMPGGSTITVQYNWGRQHRWRSSDNSGSSWSAWTTIPYENHAVTITVPALQRSRRYEVQSRFHAGMSNQPGFTSSASPASLWGAGRTIDTPIIGAPTNGSVQEELAGGHFQSISPGMSWTSPGSTGVNGSIAFTINLSNGWEIQTNGNITFSYSMGGVRRAVNPTGSGATRTVTISNVRSQITNVLVTVWRPNISVNGSSGTFTGGQWFRGGGAGGIIPLGGTMQISVFLQEGYDHHTADTVRRSLTWSGGGNPIVTIMPMEPATSTSWARYSIYLSNIRYSITNFGINTSLLPIRTYTVRGSFASNYALFSGNTIARGSFYGGTFTGGWTVNHGGNMPITISLDEAFRTVSSSNIHVRFDGGGGASVGNVTGTGIMRHATITNIRGNITNLRIAGSGGGGGGGGGGDDGLVRPNWTVTASVSGSTGGTVSPTSASVASGSSHTVRATAHSGFRLASFSGPGTTSGNERRIASVLDNGHVTATFERIPIAWDPISNMTVTWGQGGSRTVHTATGGDGSFTYSAVSTPAGIEFHGGSREVRIPTSIPVGSYTVTLRASGNAQNVDRSFSVTVIRANAAAPGMPGPATINAAGTQAEFPSITNGFYRARSLPNGPWTESASPLFNILPGLEYEFQQRFRETATHNTSPWSEPGRTLTMAPQPGAPGAATIAAGGASASFPAMPTNARYRWRPAGGNWTESSTPNFNIVAATNYEFQQRTHHTTSINASPWSTSTMLNTHATPPAPSIASLTDDATSVTLTGTANHEYRMSSNNGSTWTTPQTTTTFTGINTGVAYIFQQRQMFTTTHNTSPWSANRTWTVPSYTISPMSGTGGSWTASTTNTSRFHGSVHTITVTAGTNWAFASPEAVSATGNNVSYGDRTDAFVRTIIVSRLTSHITLNITTTEAYRVTYAHGTTPPNGVTVQGTVPTGFKIRDLTAPIATQSFTVSNANWIHVGWREGSPLTLTHRNISHSGTTSETLWVPNGIDSWGAGTGATGAFGTVSWTTLQRELPVDLNADVTLYPIWAPRLSMVLFAPGAPTEFNFSGTFAPITFPATERLTGQPFDLPLLTFTISNGTWEQIGWTWQQNGKQVIMYQSIPNGDFDIGATVPGTNEGLAEGWSDTRTIYAVWRRVITHGSVNIVFVGGPEGFLSAALAGTNLQLWASMQFDIVDGDILHTGTEVPFSLPSFEAMTDLGERYGLVFEGWHIRKSWEPDDTQRIDDPEAPEDRTTGIPWAIGIIAPELEPFIWIEAWWSSPDELE